MKDKILGGDQRVSMHSIGCVSIGKASRPDKGPACGGSLVYDLMLTVASARKELEEAGKADIVPNPYTEHTNADFHIG